MDRLVSASLWDEIGRVTRRAKRIRAAVAYVTWPDALGLGSGDCLVTDASERAIASGQTSARVLAALIKQGVEVHSLGGLHAKVIVADSTAIVGSANASSASRKDLIEAALITSQPSLLAAACAFVAHVEAQSTRLTTERIRVLCRIPVTKRVWDGTGSKVPRPKSAKLGGRSAWFCRTFDLPDGAFPKEHALVVEAVDEIQRAFGFDDPPWIRWAGKSHFRDRAQAGDQLIVASSRRGSKRPYCVSPPAGILLRQNGGSWTRFYYSDELARPLRSLSWAEFKRLATLVGLKVSKTHEIPPEVLAELRESWPREASSKRFRKR